MKIHPIVAGVCNAVLPGLGYLLIDERKVFGWLMLAGSAACIILSFFEPAFISQTFFVSHTAGGKFLEGTWYACFLAAYGYDAWSLTRAKQAAQFSARASEKGYGMPKEAGTKDMPAQPALLQEETPKDTEDHPDPHPVKIPT